MMKPIILYPLCVFATLLIVAMILAFKIDQLYKAAEKDKHNLKSKANH